MIPRFKTIFPPQKECSRRSTKARRDRGAYSKRLHVGDAELVSFAVPIAGKQPKAHETVDPTRDGDAVPKVASRGLPPGLTVDDVIQFPDEAAAWLGVTRGWIVEHQHNLPGVIRESERVKFFHPRTYLDKRLRKFNKP